MTWNTIDGGGATFSTGGAYELGGTIGQADAGALAGGSYDLIGGFWGLCLDCQLYGDVFPSGGNCVVDIDDYLCVDSCFSGTGCFPEGDIFPCGGNGVCDIDDILAVLAAFGGDFFCPHPCPP